MQVHARTRVRSQVQALVTSIQHASASASTNTIIHASKLASNEHLCKLILLELKRFNQEYILLGTSDDHIF